MCSRLLGGGLGPLRVYLQFPEVSSPEGGSAAWEWTASWCPSEEHIQFGSSNVGGRE